MIKKFIILLILCVLPASLPAFHASAGVEHPFVLAIDAGHGGRDKGTCGRRLMEKNVTLSVAKLLGGMVEQAFGDSVKVVLTRKDDTFIGLHDRADIANRADADLFISIHVNSVAARSRGRERLAGTSVYTLGLHKTDANLEVAMAENAVIELEEDFSVTYQGFDPSMSESYIIFELNQNHNLEQSVDMATRAQRSLVANAGRVDKGVRQAGFLVLWATRMPAILVELDFMCNPRIENYLGSKDGQKELASALFEAFKEYRAANMAAASPHQ